MIPALPGTETLLCLVLLFLGSLGLFVMFWLTDRNAIDESYYGEHMEEDLTIAAKVQDKKA